jgi:uncharacterized protein
VYRATQQPDLLRFAARARPVLERRPVEHNVLLTLLADLETDAGALAGSTPLCVLVEDAGQVVGVGLCTPPRPLLLSRMPAPAIGPLVDLLAATPLALPAVTGLEPEPARFADAWRRRTGRAVRERSAQRLYELDRLAPPRGVGGSSRPARPDELDHLGAWAAAFAAESGEHVPELRAHVARRIEQQRLFVWDEGGEAVSMAALSRPVAGVVRVSLVYTPPARRRHGYASALVAAISRLALDRGARTCMLYTDAANPSSNAIYRAIGYRPRYEAAAYTFDPTP